MSATRFVRALPAGRTHLDQLAEPLAALYAETDRLDRWGRELARVLTAGGRLLAVGNGGSACQAQHLTAEIVGRYRDDRPPYAAIALCTETSALTAIGNDYGFEELFARQVRGHGREGDVLVALSTSGRSPNIVSAVEAGNQAGLTTYALTGPAPNPLADVADDAVCIEAPHTATVQELHLVAHPPRLRGLRHGDRMTRLFVIGDALLDRDLHGRAERLAPDAPVPVVDAIEPSARPGGAALAATLAARTGVEVTLVTALGRDAAGEELRALLSGIDVIDLGLHGTTPEKIRVLAGGRPVVRLDRGGEARGCGPLPPGALDGADAILVSDYGRGVAAEPTVRAALSGDVPVIWDPHPKGPEPVPGATLVTPNLKEAVAAANLKRDCPALDSPLAAGEAAGPRARRPLARGRGRRHAR